MFGSEILINLKIHFTIHTFVRQKIRTIINDGYSITFLAIKRAMA